MKKTILGFLFFFSFIHLNAQTKAEKNFGSWYMYYGNHIISDKWSILTGFEERNYQTFQNYNLVLYNIGVNYKISKKFTATTSYMYLDIDRTFDPDVNPNTIEHRYYGQIFYPTNYFKIPFSHRIRVEHRNLNAIGIKTLINRVRYRFKTKIPLYKKLYITASNESFLNFKGNLYAENRFYAAFGLKASKNISIEIGYLGHYINDLHLDRLQVGLFLKTDFRKKVKH
ncbi:DUF2490 domain-containing protein [uncultured Polaribacter sp.]|uniref:DUF2490 domain-containing protein n=1 Tax=uncultured Polaribacter sp. TaxID=174711 RepID=UPI0026229A94|nr:DUF2490 domain-containing protein [uncultured Polaribacter sp.]